MPLYEYQCEACGRRFEVIQKFSDPAPASCKHCDKGPVQRLMSSPAIQFKGSGWYITDYAKKSGSEASSGSGSGSSKAESADTAKSDTAKSDGAKGDSPASETKSATSGGTTTSGKE